jgi:hypothetical protein
VTNAADRHQVDRMRERRVLSQRLGIDRHHGPHRRLLQPQVAAGEPQDHVPLGEEAREAALVHDEDAPVVLLAHQADRLRDGGGRGNDGRRRGREGAQRIGEDAALHAAARVRDSRVEQVRPARLAQLGAGDVLEIASRTAAHDYPPSVRRAS